MVPPVPNFDATDTALEFLSLLDEPVLHSKTPADVAAQAADFNANNPKNLLLLQNLEGDKFVNDIPGPSQIALYENYTAAADINCHDF